MAFCGVQRGAGAAEGSVNCTRAPGSREPAAAPGSTAQRDAGLVHRLHRLKQSLLTNAASSLAALAASFLLANPRVEGAACTAAAASSRTTSAAGSRMDSALRNHTLWRRPRPKHLGDGAGADRWLPAATLPVAVG